MTDPRNPIQAAAQTAIQFNIPSDLTGWVVCHRGHVQPHAHAYCTKCGARLGGGSQPVQKA